jgi:group I intron endonuclease
VDKLAGFDAYMITCLASGKRYIGITTQGIRKRWNEHLSTARQILRRHTKLARAITKYGERNFSIEVIACSWCLSDLLVLEALLIEQHNTRRDGLNSTMGGDGVFGYRHDLKSTRKMTLERLRLWQTPEYRSKISEAQKRAWAKKSQTEITAHKERAKHTLEKNRGKIQDILQARVKPVRPKLGKGYNMKSKTHCPSGHPYDEFNTYTSLKGRRTCRQCKRRSRNLARDRRRAAKREGVLTI